MRGNQEYISFI